MNDYLRKPLKAIDLAPALTRAQEKRTLPARSSGRDH